MHWNVGSLVDGRGRPVVFLLSINPIASAAVVVFKIKLRKWGVARRIHLGHNAVGLLAKIKCDRPAAPVCFSQSVFIVQLMHFIGCGNSIRYLRRCAVEPSVLGRRVLHMAPH